MKTLLFWAKIFAIGVGGLAMAFCLLLAYLTITEYRPAPVEEAALSGAGNQNLALGAPLRVLSWNIGYASLDHTQDFFMDGGKTVRPRTDAAVRENIRGIRDFLVGAGADAVLLQEVDQRAHRSYNLDQRAYIAEAFSGVSAYARNFRCRFVPIPLPPIGAVDSGLLTLTAAVPDKADRVALPSPFTWPVRIANLKRCLLVERIPLAGTDRELVLANLHLEAYAANEGRLAQMRILTELLEAEYAKGNYCIAGGDFNQTFPGAEGPLFSIKLGDSFVPGTLDEDMLPVGWRFAADPGAPSSRLLNEPYSGDPQSAQLYLIDGFILSPNVGLLSVKTVDAGFRYSDHNPVLVEAVLR
jgi:endonuclease/exonuclease/phosphatase family metal-dependent hydrolase